MERTLAFASVADGNGGQLGPAGPIVVYALHYRIGAGSPSSSIIKDGDQNGTALITLPRVADSSGVWLFAEGVLFPNGLFADIGAETTLCTIAYQTL